MPGRWPCDRGALSLGGHPLGFPSVLTKTEYTRPVGAAGTTWPMTSRPDRHTQRYDRQLRLWNKSGQSSLESAHVLVVGASALSSHILKNLVLPGLGSFTVCDDARVTPDDVASNFFLETDSVGASYAEELVRLVRELNPATSAHACTKAPAWLLEHEPAFFTHFSLIVCVRQTRSVAEALADYSWHQAPPIPVVCARNSGFQGYVGVSVGELGIMETHPDSLVDLRLTRPFPELSAYARQFAVDPSDSLAKSHTPYIVLILRALDAWASRHHGDMPTSAERREFIDTMTSQRAEYGDAENMDEALAALAQHVWRPLQSPAVPAHVTALFDDAQCRHSSNGFWLLVATLRAFVQQCGTLPLTGAVPDMKAMSLEYAALQRIYVDQARRDLDMFEHILDGVVTKAGTSREAAGLEVDTVRTFVKHAAFLQLVRGRRLRLQRTEPNVGALATALADPVNPVTAPYHLAFVASDTFYEHTHRYPGQRHDWQADIDPLFSHAKTYCTSIGLELSDCDQMRLQHACYEMARGAHSDTPSTSAYLGGIAAQEVIKIITVQYIPLDNTCVYDGFEQAVSSFRL